MCIICMIAYFRLHWPHRTKCWCASVSCFTTLSLSLSLFFCLLSCCALPPEQQTKHIFYFLLYPFFCRAPKLCLCRSIGAAAAISFSFSILSKLQLRKTIDCWKWKHKSGVLARKKEEDSRSAVAYKWSSADV